MILLLTCLVKGFKLRSKKLLNSSNINVVISAVLNPSFLLPNDFERTKSIKSTKSTKKHQKAQKHKDATTEKHKNANKQKKKKKKKMHLKTS